MDRASLPFLLIASPAARTLAGRDLAKIAVLALQAMIRHRRSIEVAHQQISYRRNFFAFSSRVGRHGDLILELDVGDPRLAGRLVLEADLRRAELQAARERDGRRPR
jgi:hypothetical protein